MADTENYQADRLDLLQVEGAYSAFFDTRQGEPWADLFTEDGSYEGRAFSREPGPVAATGRAELARLCAEFPLTIGHIVGIPHFVIGESEAVARISYCSIGMQETAGFGLVKVSHGYYDVRYHRTAEGWRIHRRISHSLSSAETRQGRAAGALPVLEMK